MTEPLDRKHYRGSKGCFDPIIAQHGRAVAIIANRKIGVPALAVWASVGL